MTYTLTESGLVLTETQDGVTMPADYSFATVNDYVHSFGTQYEELQCLALGMACHIDNLTKQRDELLLALNQIIWKLERKEVVGSKFDGGVRCEFAKIDRNDAVIGLARSAIAAARGAA